MHKSVKKFAKIKKESDALKFGLYKQITVRHELLCFARITNDEYIIVVLNSSKQVCDINLDIHLPGTKLTDILNNGGSFCIQFGT